MCRSPTICPRDQPRTGARGDPARASGASKEPRLDDDGAMRLLPSEKIIRTKRGASSSLCVLFFRSSRGGKDNLGKPVWNERDAPPGGSDSFGPSAGIKGHAVFLQRRISAVVAPCRQRAGPRLAMPATPLTRVPLSWRPAPRFFWRASAFSLFGMPGMKWWGPVRAPMEGPFSWR